MLNAVCSCTADSQIHVMIFLSAWGHSNLTRKNSPNHRRLIFSYILI